MLLSSSVQFRMASVRLVKPICTPPHLPDVFRTLPLKQLPLTFVGWPFLVHSRKIVECFLFYGSLLRAIDGMMSLVLCPLLESRASHLFRSSETQATCDSCFASQSIFSVISHDSGMSRTLVHPHKFSTGDFEH